MIRFETSVRIERPRRRGRPLRLRTRKLPPLELGRSDAAKDVLRRGPVGSTYAMARQLPRGQAENELEITAYERPRQFAIRTLSGPTRFIYRYGLPSRDDATLLELDAEVELPGPAAPV